MKSFLSALLGALVILSWMRPANASCPYSFDTSGIVNGQVADATPVANNFNYIITCPAFANVGIGAPSSGYGLDVNASAAFRGSTYIYDAELYAYNSPSNKYLEFLTSGSGVGQIGMTDTSNLELQGNGGNVGIDTTDPVYALDINGTTAFRSTAYVYDNLYAYEASTGKYLGFYTTGGVGHLTMTDVSALELQGYGGNVGIGTGSPAVALTVAGDIRVGTSGSNGCLENYAGTALAGTCSSDAALKTVRGNVTGVLDKLASLQLVRFNWNATAQRIYSSSPTVLSTGFIAQNVAAQFPELVSFDSKGYRQLDYSTLSLYGLEAIKELKSENDRQAAEIVELQSRLAREELHTAQTEKSASAAQQSQSAQIESLEQRVDALERALPRRSADDASLAVH